MIDNPRSTLLSALSQADEAHLVARGSRLCRRITREYAQSFYFASHCLPRRVRAHAYAIYGFCRWADNAVDESTSLHEATCRVDYAREILDLAYSGRPVPAGLAAFRQTVRERGIPRGLFESLLDGMEMDLSIDRYPDFPSLDVYCYRVAGVVGLMMTHVFGYRNDRCFVQAQALGTAMQLTNILRDIREDLDRGRIYLPQDELSRFGVGLDQLARGHVDDRFRSLLRFQIERARRYYQEARIGIPDLDGYRARLTVRVMGRVYSGILDAIERLDYDVFSTRAQVPTIRKLGLLMMAIQDERRGR